MALFDLFKVNKPIQKATKNSFNTEYIPNLWEGTTFYNIESTAQNDKALINMFNDIPEINAPINFIIDSLSIIPFNHYRDTNKGNLIVNDSKVMSIINEPNQYQTENDFIKMFFINRIVLGAGYINRIMPTGFRTIKQLFVLPTQHTTPVLLNDKKSDIRTNSIVGYETELGNQKLVIDKSNVFIQRETSLIDNNYYKSRSRLMSAILTSDSLKYNYEARIKMLKDRGAVGIISPKNEQYTITPQDADNMRRKWYANQGMTGVKYPFDITGTPTEFTSTSMNAAELKLNENKTQDFGIVCNVLGIDPALFGIGNNTYNNKKLAKTAFYEDTIIPYFDNYLQLLSKIFNLPKNEYLKADYSQIAAMQEDYDKIVSSNTKLWNDELITEKEAREATGFEGGEDKKKSELSTVVNTNKE